MLAHCNNAHPRFAVFEPQRLKRVEEGDAGEQQSLSQHPVNGSVDGVGQAAANLKPQIEHQETGGSKSGAKQVKQGRQKAKAKV
jgi:hypothetical protein